MNFLSCRNFEVIGTFLHLVTPSEEQAMHDNKLRKILPFHNYIKSKCYDLYQPLRELSIDERMVKSKARTHFRQYIKNKPTKWGMKYWVLADRSGYTVDFNIYAGKSTLRSDKGLSYDVVMELIRPYAFQGYQLFFDNFYTSPVLLESLLEYGIVSTGTLNVTRKEVPKEVVSMKKMIDKSITPRGTGYYYRPRKSSITYCVWRDTKSVTMASTAFPGHSVNNVVRRVKDKRTGSCVSKEVPCPQMLFEYNKSMGGVDKSDQYISYHKVLRSTVKYWKTMFYHMLDIITVNSHILYNWYRLSNSLRIVTENQFRDSLILEIISTYGILKRSTANTVPKQSSGMSACRIRHGSKLVSTKGRCVYCRLHGKKRFTQRKCPDCPLQPALCQVMDRDCHSDWHSDSFKTIRTLWYEHIQMTTLPSSSSSQPSSSRSQQSKGPVGRPKGSINRRRRRGNYRKI